MMDNLGPLQDFFRTGATHPYEFRLRALNRLEALAVENSDRICEALFKDLRKPEQEGLLSEVAVVIEEIRLAKKNLRRWMRPRRERTPLPLWPSQSRVHFEPLGTVLIIGPWNYPFQLTLAPLIGAIAAGNCAVIKPSELTSHTSALIANLIAGYFDSNHVRVVQGGIAESTVLLNQKFDHIFFTGSTPIGKIVMQAAAKNLVPVTLELGGKSPVVVFEDADLDLAAKRIVWGKFYNAGQTCVAPDYLYVQKSVAQNLVQKIKTQIEAQFGKEPQSSKSLGRIVNSKNLDRLAKMIDPRKVLHGGETDAKDLYIAPTVLGNVSWDDPVMREEIFGPILPVLEFERAEELYRFLNQRPKPLSAYVFSRSKATQKDFVEKVPFGGGCANDVVVHLSNPYLPFGGVGESGIGRYHGEDSFRAFSHAKSVMYRTGFLDVPARYAPYNEKKLNFLKRIFRL